MSRIIENDEAGEVSEVIDPAQVLADIDADVDTIQEMLDTLGDAEVEKLLDIFEKMQDMLGDAGLLED